MNAARNPGAYCHSKPDTPRPGEQQHRAGEPEQRADDVMRRKPFARQER